MWIACQLLWCFYQVSELSFWRHPFTAENQLLSIWCNVTFLQFCFNEETNSSTSWMAWGTATFIFGWTIPLNYVVCKDWILGEYILSNILPNKCYQHPAHINTHIAKLTSAASAKTLPVVFPHTHKAKVDIQITSTEKYPQPWSTPSTAHFVCLPISDTPTSGLAVSTNELMSWIRCDRWGRHTRCEWLGVLQDMFENHWSR